MLSRGRESCSLLPCKDKEEGRKAQLTVPHLIPEENKDTIPQITCLDTLSFKSEHVFRGLCFLQPAEPSFQEISWLSWWPERFSCAGLDSCLPIGYQRDSFTKLLYPEGLAFIYSILQFLWQISARESRWQCSQACTRGQEKLTVSAATAAWHKRSNWQKWLLHRWPLWFFTLLLSLKRLSCKAIL